jgi:hypothetical protein
MLCSKTLLTVETNVLHMPIIYCLFMGGPMMATANVFFGLQSGWLVLSIIRSMQSLRVQQLSLGSDCDHVIFSWRLNIPPMSDSLFK